MLHVLSHRPFSLSPRKPPCDNMASTTTEPVAPPRRRSARFKQQDEMEVDEPVPVVKKKKKRETAEEAPKEKKTTKKRKKAVNTDDDGFECGFTFSKRTSSRLSTTQAEPAPVKEEAPAVPKATKRVKKETGEDKKRTVAEALRESPTPTAKAVKKKKPREKEKEQELVPEEPAEEKRKPVVEKKGRRREEKKEPEETVPQTVQRPNGNSTTAAPAPRTASRLPVPITDGSKIMLPTSDTPIQRKNQALRKGAGADRRRSSLGLRGRRASTMMEDGIMCEPHSEIFHADFYKHIDESQMENTRMKQLLTWCGKRELDSGVLKEADPNASNSGTEEGARKIARMLAEDLLKEVSTNGQLSTWFTRDASPAPETIKKPNPRNESNKADQERLKAQLATLNKEHASWMSLMNLKPNFTVPTPSTNDSTLLRPSEAAARASLASRQDILSNARKLCKLQSSEIELNIDRLEYGVHKLKSFQGMADSLAGITLQTAGDVLEAREKGIKLAAETQEIETMDVLRAISWAQAEGVDTA